MQLINLQQNSNEWHDYRRTRIGASDFNFFCRHKKLYTPYYKIKKDDTLEKHFYNKINNVQFTNPFIEKGKELEPYLLEDYNKLTEGCFVPTVGQYEGNYDVFASYDGYDIFIDDEVEIKTTSKSPDFEMQLLESYLFQVIHQMNVGDLDRVVILINYYNYNITKHYTVHRDKDCYMVYFLNKKICEYRIDFRRWHIICDEYLTLLKEATNAISNI